MSRTKQRAMRPGSRRARDGKLPRQQAAVPPESDDVADAVAAAAKPSRAAHKAARRAKRRTGAAFDLAAVSDGCAALALDLSRDYYDVGLSSHAQAKSVRRLAVLYGLSAPLRLEKRSSGSAETLRLTRSPFRVAALPSGDAEIKLAKLLAAACAGWPDEPEAEGGPAAEPPPAPPPAKKRRPKQAPAAAAALPPVAAAVLPDAGIAAVEEPTAPLVPVPWFFCRSVC